MAVTMNRVGNGAFKLWVKNGAPKKVAVLDAHGGPLHTTFVTGIPVLFFTRTGAPLMSLDHKKLNIALNDPIETVPANRACDNYVLGKFQGYHTENSETYGDITAWVEENDWAVLSVRHRKGLFKKSQDPTLEDAVDVLDSLGYEAIRVLICRGDQVQAKVDSFDPKYKLVGM